MKQIENQDGWLPKSPRAAVTARLTRGSRRGPALLWAAALLWIAGAPRLHAQTLYEWHEPNGTVVYSQSAPAPGEGKVTRTLVLKDLSGTERAAAVRVAAQSMTAGAPPMTALARADARIGRALSALDSADARVRRALTTLQRAEQALHAGQTPKPGERRPLVHGHSRLTRAYFERIKAQEVRVAQARAALQSAYAARDALVP